MKGHKRKEVTPDFERIRTATMGKDVPLLVKALYLALHPDADAELLTTVCRYAMEEPEGPAAGTPTMPCDHGHKSWLKRGAHHE
jgi:hypothetical protein